MKPNRTNRRLVQRHDGFDERPLTLTLSPRGARGYSSLRRRSAFTLIEILTVVAIIGVLAALLFPAIKGALQKAEVAQAQNDIQNIQTAVKMFYTEYGKWPNPWPSNAGSINDVSYGALSSGTYGPSTDDGYYKNYWLMNVLRAIPDVGSIDCGNGGTVGNSVQPTPINSRGIVFITIPTKSLKIWDSQHGYADYVDPWGNPYQITLDTSYDNICSNLAGTLVSNPGVATPAGTLTYAYITNTVAVWSFGPLGPNGTHTKASDWITSWY